MPARTSSSEGPALTDWLLAELDRAEVEAVRVHADGCEDTCRGPEHTLAWIKMMRAFVLKHRAGPTYVANVCDPTGPDVPDGWHCQECGLDRDGPTDDWPCEVLVMVATLLWYAQRPNRRWHGPGPLPRISSSGAEGVPAGNTTGAGREPVEPEFRTYDGADPDDDVLGMNIAAAPDQGQ